MKKTSLLALIFLPVLCSAQEEKPYTPSLDPTSMDRSIDPCTNFFQYSCGAWNNAGSGIRFAIRLVALASITVALPADSFHSTAAIDAATFPGADWLTKVNAAAATLTHGGTIEVPDVIAGASSAIGTVPGNVTLQFSGSATFSFCQINLGPFAKIYSRGALLQISGPGCTGIRQENRAILQTTDKFILDGVRIDCCQQPESTGIFVGAGHAQTVMRDVTVANCATGIRLDGAQFGEYSNLSLYHNQVGLKIYTTLGGGGNSNTFYGLKAVGNTVGVLIAETASFGMGPDYFVNPSLLSNSVAAMAVFGHRSPVEVHWYGGAPEVNGGGPPSIAIDGHIVKQATVYANLARITLNEVEIEEATISPVVRAENSSAITLNNVSGYGRSDGTLVSADRGSTTTLEGRLDILGTIENVIAYPQVLASPTYVRMFGAPLVSMNREIPNAFQGDAMTPHPADIQGSVSTSESRDPQLGPVTTVQHAPVRGSQESNRVSFGNVIPASAGAERSVLLSILLKASVDCNYVLGGYADGYATTRIPLVAGEWTRALIYKAKSAAGKGFALVGWPDDASGPAVSFSALQVLAEPADSFAARAYMGSVLTTGAVNPNHNP